LFQFADKNSKRSQNYVLKKVTKHGSIEAQGPETCRVPQPSSRPNRGRPHRLQDQAPHARRPVQGLHSHEKVQARPQPVAHMPLLAPPFHFFLSRAGPLRVQLLQRTRHSLAVTVQSGGLVFLLRQAVNDHLRKG